MADVKTVPRVHRTYNKWVANQTLEDYSLRFTAHSVRKFSSWSIANTAIGAVSFLALEAIGGAITLNYGFYNVAWAIAVATLLITLMGVPVCYYAAKFGVDIDLLTRGAGFGYIGSTVTSLIYASFTFIFFAIEAAIIALALELCLGLPLYMGYFLSALVIIPLVTHGITFISRFQSWTQPIWIILQLAPFVFLLSQSLPTVRAWTGYTGLLGPIDSSFNLGMFGIASAVLFSLIAQIGEQVDYLRFLPRKTHKNRFAWWSALLVAGPGWMLLGSLKLFAGSFLAYYALSRGVDFAKAAEPTQMYLTVFTDMVKSPEFGLGLMGIFVVICQLKINVTNSYAGSLAWSNFFSRLTHSHPGRVVWLGFNVLLGLLLMLFGVHKALEQILGLYSILAVAWMAAIVADLVINKPFGLSPKRIEFKRAYLYDINPVGFGSMCMGVLLALMAYFGLFGETLSKLYTFVALGSAFFLSPILAIATKGKYYLAREPRSEWQAAQSHECVICEHSFDTEDMAHCPLYQGSICSLCCSLDARCHDACKPHGRMMNQVMDLAYKVLPPNLAKKVDTSLVRYLALMTAFTAILSLVFGLIYFQSTLDASVPSDIIGLTLTKLFAIILIILGIVVWLIVLAQQSRKRAEEEVSRHTELLMNEIASHEETDRQLQKAKEVAESANLAKSKYLVGLSHELRTPLNAILGYAQLLERQKDQQPYVHNAARIIKRSGDHLGGMIEGLLDISKIEAGKLEIYRQKIVLRTVLDQIVDMFALQARNKGIVFEFHAQTPLPEYVTTDEKRFRQILINLLSNAIKFTQAGKVEMLVSYRNQIATFEIRDTGPGIADADLERIFLPFERIEQPEGAEPVPGTGLGLTITRLLADIMGGDLRVSSTVGQGTCFTLRLMLSSSIEPGRADHAHGLVTGYFGAQKTLLVCDDDPTQRQLMLDILEPIGFVVKTAENANACLKMLEHERVDLIILDISMPGLSGWQLAAKLRPMMGNKLPIIMCSAEAGEERNRPEYQELHDGYLIKPFELDSLYNLLSTHLDLCWKYGQNDAQEAKALLHFENYQLPDAKSMKQIITLAELGFLRSVDATIKEIKHQQPASRGFCEHLQKLVQSQNLKQLIAQLEHLKAQNVS